VAKAKIIGTGSYAPERVVTNTDLERTLETSDQWIRERTGIRERRIAAPGEATSDMATKASVRALEMASVRPEDVELIVVGTITADMPMPSCAAIVQGKLGAKKAFAFDVAAACAGGLYALSVADQYIRSGAVKSALAIGADIMSSVVNWNDRNTAVLFGDAAGALVLAPSTDDRGVIATQLRTDGTCVDMLCIRGGGSLHPINDEVVKSSLNKLSMNGREVFKFAVRALSDSLVELLESQGLSAQAVDHVIAHQANSRILEAVLERVGIPKEKCWLNLEKYGNTSAASMPMTLDEANRAGRISKGQLIAFLSIGAGMAWGTSLLRW
jgi:3-oxoacyl-[acyl-carrier-protein] synthase-3